MNRDRESSRRDFLQQAELPSPGFLREVWAFLAHRKKWWLAPIVILLLLVAGLAVLSSTAAAPMIYSLF